MLDNDGVEFSLILGQPYESCDSQGLIILEFKTTRLAYHFTRYGQPWRIKCPCDMVTSIYSNRESKMESDLFLCIQWESKSECIRVSWMFVVIHFSLSSSFFLFYIHIFVSFVATNQILEQIIWIWFLRIFFFKFNIHEIQFFNMIFGAREVQSRANHRLAQINDRNISDV